MPTFNNFSSCEGWFYLWTLICDSARLAWSSNLYLIDGLCVFKHILKGQKGETTGQLQVKTGEINISAINYYINIVLLIMLTQLFLNILHVLIYILISTHFQIQVETQRHSGKINNCHFWTGMEENVNLTNWEIISFVCRIVSAGNYCVCWADIHLLRLFPEGFGRRLSKWRLVRNGLMTGAACLSFLLVFAPLRIVSITLTGSYIGSSEWLNSHFFLFSHSKNFCLAVNQQILSIPSPSLTARLAPHCYDCPSAHRQGLSARLCGSSHGSFLLQPAN